MRILTGIFAAVCLSACVNVKDSGDYPRGFIACGQMHYWNPALAYRVWGPNRPIGKPLSSDYVIMDDESRLYVSPELAKKLKECRLP